MRAAAQALRVTEALQDGLTPAARDMAADFDSLCFGTGSMTQQQELGGLIKTSAFEAGHVLEVVKRSCGPASKDLLHLLAPLLSALMKGSIKVNLPLLAAPQDLHKVVARTSKPCPIDGASALAWTFLLLVILQYLCICAELQHQAAALSRCFPAHAVKHHALF